MTTTEITMSEFVTKHGVTLKATRSKPTPADRRNWSERSHHWTVVLYKGDGRYRTRFHQGEGHTEPPTAEDVLDCMASDSVGVENNDSFEKWCAEYGLDTGPNVRLGDYQERKRTYYACVRASERLKKLLGEDAYKELLWETARL